MRCGVPEGGLAVQPNVNVSYWGSWLLVEAAVSTGGPTLSSKHAVISMLKRANAAHFMSIRSAQFAASARSVRERRRRDGSFWVAKGAVAMAVLAALSLAITVLFAERALDNAADVVVRGDGDTLVADVVVDLWRSSGR